MQPIVDRLRERYGDRVIFTALDVDQANTEPMRVDLGYRFRPHFVLLAPDGAILQQWVGSVRESDFVNALENALK